jgi:CRP-like cAMP-binding protein
MKDSNMDDLKLSKLFAGISMEEQQVLFKKISLRSQKYVKGELIAFEGDECSSIGIVLSGEIIIQQLLPSGKKLVIDTLSPGNSFGEVIIFSDQKTYPASIEANEPSQILFISKENVLSLCALSQVFLNNFMNLLSNKILMLNRKVKSLSLQSPRQKTLNFIFENYQRQNSELLTFTESRKEMAELLNLPRPSLSRELAKLKNAGWIDFDRDWIKIVNLQRLENEFNETI